jgi:hypothetical protein
LVLVLVWMLAKYLTTSVAPTRPKCYRADGDSAEGCSHVDGDDGCKLHGYVNGVNRWLNCASCRFAAKLLCDKVPF